MLKQCLENIGVGLLHTCISILSIKPHVIFPTPASNSDEGHSLETSNNKKRRIILIKPSVANVLEIYIITILWFTC
jgi:hypothetical protein